MDLEDTGVLASTSGVVERTLQETTDRDFLADRLIEEQQKRRSILEPTQNMRLLRLYAKAEFQTAVLF